MAYLLTPPYASPATHKSRTKMMKLLYIIILGILWGRWGEGETFISPGLQIGFNTNKEFFYGFQLSLGILIGSTYNSRNNT